MEEEMNKFRGELISRESDNFRKTSARWFSYNLIYLFVYQWLFDKPIYCVFLYSKSLFSSSESRTLINGKEVEGSKSSFSARFQCTWYFYFALVWNIYFISEEFVWSQTRNSSRSHEHSSRKISIRLWKEMWRLSNLSCGRQFL